MTAKPAQRGRPAKITREKLAAAASELGFSDFKLMEVARRLNVTLQTLYNHVRDRDELLHLAAEVLEESYAFPTGDDLEWTDWWRAWAYSLKDIYNRTPGLATILMSRPLVSAPPLTEHWETAQRIAERHGFSPIEALWANMAVHEFVYSWSAREDQLVRQMPASDRAPKLDPAFAARSPRFAAAVKLSSEREHDERFAMSLEALLAGLSSRISRSADNQQGRGSNTKG